MLVILTLFSQLSIAQPGGNGDGLRSGQCGGSCHADASQNATSTAEISINTPGSTWAGLLTSVTIDVSDFPVDSESRILGVFLLIDNSGAQDRVMYDGWEIISDPNGGVNNYVETRLSSSTDTKQFTWILKSPETPGRYSLMGSIQHGGEGNQVPFHKNSEIIYFSLVSPPDNLPRLSENFEPPTTRLINEQTTITLLTEDVNNMQIEWRLEGGQTQVVEVVNGSFTLPAAINPGLIEWRAILAGEGPNQTTPWFQLIAHEPLFSVASSSMYFQGIALLIFCIGIVRRVKNFEPREKETWIQDPNFAIPQVNGEMSEHSFELRGDF